VNFRIVTPTVQAELEKNAAKTWASQNYCLSGMSDSSVGNLDFVDIHAQIESGREVRLPENSEDASQQLDALEFRSNNLLPLLDRFWRSIGHDEQLQEKLIFSDSMTIVHWWWKLRGGICWSPHDSISNFAFCFAAPNNENLLINS
jgi:hypothetical protein